jgi:vitamin K-dependent gamma-carboxylase
MSPRLGTVSSHRERCLTWLSAEADGAGLTIVRIVLGLILSASALRFVLKDWVREIYVAPRFHFTYFGFDWVRPWPETWMTLHVLAMGACGALIALGLFTRAAALGYFFLFTYAELIEKAAYLNHYYLVSILVLFLAFVPANQVWSLDKKWHLTPHKPVKNAHYALFRAQLALVYAYAGLAKLNPDWLLRAEPVHTWLRAYADLPLIGPWVGTPALAFFMSYFGAAYDLSVPFLLTNRKTRPFAAAAGASFHLAISYLFPVGVFSYVMLTGLTSFFEPGWPRRFVQRFARKQAEGRVDLQTPLSPATEPRAAAEPRGRPAKISCLTYLAVAHLGVQLLVPLRFVLYPGHVNWTEQGFRFSWRVMLIEKAGFAEFHVSRPLTGETFLVLPRDELTPLQRRQMATQPDMIHEYALHLSDAFRTYPGEPVEVRVDSFVAWNGRPNQRLIDPMVDLAATPRTLGPTGWILPSPAIFHP